MSDKYHGHVHTPTKHLKVIIVFWSRFLVYLLITTGHKNPPHLYGLGERAACRIRTDDLLITSELLYQLS